MKKRLIVIFFFAISSYSCLLAQKYNFTYTSAYGFIIRHSPRMGKLSEKHFPFFELSIRKLTTGNKEWHSVYKFPEIGLDIGVAAFHNPILGTAFYAIPFIEKPLAKSTKSAFNFKIGSGLFYLTNPYNPETNSQNVAISTHLGYAMRGEFSFHYQLLPQLRIRTILMMSHFSNASFKQPNSGVNIPMIGLGVSYLPGFQKIKMIPDTFSHKFEKGVTFNISGAATVREIGLPGDKKYLGFNLLTYVNKRLNRKSALNIGIDFFINSAQKKLIREDTTVSPHTDYKQAGFAIGHELFINRLSMLTQIGVYFYAPYPNFGPVYQRYLLKYWVTPRFYTGIALKSHYGTAEYVEWTTGLKIKP